MDLSLVERQLLQPCERVVWYILPYVRSELVRELEKLGLTQQEIAKELNLTQPAVSQYIAGNRARVEKLDDHISYMLKELAREIEEGEVENLSGRICEICSYVKENPELLRSCDLKK